MVYGKNLNEFIWNTTGFIVLFLGTTLFYEGFKSMILEFITDNPYYKFMLGFVFLVIAYKIFGKKNGLFSN